MKKIVKNWISIIALVALIGIIIYYPTLFMGKDFFWYNDQQFQYQVFYQEWNNIIQEIKNSHTLAVYSWNTFLGTDFFVSKLFTCVGDFIATPFFIIYNGEINYNVLLCVETIICLVISTVTMKLFLKKFGIKNEFVINVFSIIYGFSGYVMVFSGSYMFHRFYSLFPLLLYYCEKYIQNRKLFGFCLTTALLFLQNYELMFSASLFLILYFIFSFKIKNINNIAEILKKAIPLIISYLIGIMIVSFALFPLLLFIKDSTRIGSFSYGGILWELKEIVYFISNYFYAPISMNSNVPNYLFYSSNYAAFEYSFFISPLIITALLNINQLQKKERNLYIVVEILLVSFSLFKPLNMIVHGFSEPSFRWSFILVLFNCLFSANMFDKCTLKANLKIMLSLILVITLVFFISMYFDGKLNRNYSVSIVIYCISILSVVLFCFLSNKYKKFILLLATIECIFCYTYSICSAWNKYNNIENKFNREYLDYFRNIDEDRMYRMYFKAEEIPPFSTLCLNNSIEYGYMSTTTYDSAYSWILNDFLSKNGYHNWIIDINNPDLLNMLGVKYIGVLNDTSIIKGIDTDFAYNLDNLKIYKIKNYNHIGHTYSKFIKESSATNSIDWNNELIVPDDYYNQFSQYREIQKAQLDVVEYNRQYLKANLDVSGNSVLFVGIPYSKGWNIIDQNNNKLTSLKVQGGFLGVVVDENVKELKFYYGTPGLKVGLIFSFVGIIGSLCLLFNDKRKKYNN